MPATCITGANGMTLGREYMGKETVGGCQPVNAFSRFSATSDSKYWINGIEGLLALSSILLLT